MHIGIRNLSTNGQVYPFSQLLLFSCVLIELVLPVEHEQHVAMRKSSFLILHWIDRPYDWAKQFALVNVLDELLEIYF